ncbi:MAG: hypothetical protein CVT82_12190 [Alphaproteobacteria bacterium HGW-Alphaproteobacteria-4]|nr:MAG: hypothetical protein CVT82_12190 [Alphaproteobacteria bacterium HGW-Alphaproteobacteria-4]
MEMPPKELLAALRDAEAKALRRRSRLRVEAGDQSYPVLRRWKGGFALDAAQVSQLRGLVELHDGSRHLATCLIIASAVEAGELICAIKRETAVRDRAALDFVRDEAAPVGYLPRT